MDSTHSFDDDFEATIVGVRHREDGAASAESVGHYLVAVDGAEPGRRIEIGADPLTIGRDARQTLVFAADTELSRAHARVLLANGQVIVEDLRSTNGTFVDAQRVTATAVLREGSVLRAGRQLFKYERRSRREVEQAQALERDLVKANRYVQSMLPPPLSDGPVRVDWCFVPSAQLGGDAFGYYWLDPDRFVFYLLDVSGHGVGAAMHSVTVMNVLRQRALPGVDFASPGEVLASLNDRFQMDSHDGMYFTMWYGVYRPQDRTLVHSSAGHHPAYLLPPDKAEARTLGSPSLMIGAMPEQVYDVIETLVEPESSVYVFSDGVFEIVTADEQQWSLADFEPLMLDAPVPGVPEPERLYRQVRSAARPGLLDDDFSLMALRF